MYELRMCDFHDPSSPDSQHFKNMGSFHLAREKTRDETCTGSNRDGIKAVCMTTGNHLDSKTSPPVQDLCVFLMNSYDSLQVLDKII